MSDITRRNLLKGAAVGAASISTLGVLAACASEPKADATANADKGTDGSTTAQYKAEVLDPKTMLDPKTASNFDVVADTKAPVGTTIDNLKTAIAGETAATTKYSAWADVAKKEGFSQLERLFRCTAEAEKTHIGLEFDLLSKLEPGYQKPAAPDVPTYKSDLNLIAATNGELYETSDMYPSFVKKAKEEGNDDAVQVFSRAKLAEAYHAEHYLDAYSTIDTPTDDKYYLCPICGYIHKGENFVACPICLTPKEKFTAY